MNGMWQQITQDCGMGIVPSHLMLPSQILAQASDSSPNVDLNVLQANLLEIGRAVGILVIGAIVAWIISGGVGALFKKTNIDNKIAGWVTGTKEGQELPPVEKWISTIVFWLLMVFVLVAFFNQLGLTAVSEPLNTFLNQITGFLPQLGGAACGWVLPGWWQRWSSWE